MSDTSSPPPEPGGEPDGADPVDLDAVERDLDDVQAALDRLNDGTYWTDEVTGEPIPDAVLAADPTARAAGRRAGSETPAGSG